MTIPHLKCLICGTNTDTVDQPCENCQNQWAETLVNIRRMLPEFMMLENGNNKLETLESLTRTASTSRTLVRLSVIDTLHQLRSQVNRTLVSLGINAKGVDLSDKLTLCATSDLTYALVEDLEQYKTLHAHIKQAITTTANSYPCLNPKCEGRIRAVDGKTEGKCPICHSIWHIEALKNNIHQRISNSNALVSSSQASIMLKTVGLDIKPTRIRKWAHDGHIHGSENGYKISEIYNYAIEKEQK